ncbi:hypothetical protein O181_113298 [Austropuccinia psidii MF-1]|uniref:Uncharacterized protein n=1 Tax=Austropuccinia psidii MF-1 TaxID=1389203 RepID=A0A9Q3K2S1_9BASI|nr:hypothetical protein [Austropuccinia psidii MF-1]
MPTLTLELDSTSPPNPLQRLACLRAHTPLQMRLQHCPHISVLTTPYTSTPPSSSPWIIILTLLRGPQVMPLTPPSPPLTPPRSHRLPSLRSYSARQTCLQCSLLSLALWSAFLTCLQCRLPTLRLWIALLTCLQSCLPSLCLQCPANMPPMLRTILMLAVPSWHASDAPYHPYACGVPSQHASKAAYHPYARSALPTCL